MSKRFTIVAGALSACVLLGAVTAAQQPRITNGRITSQAGGAGLAQAFKALVAAQADTAWIGYSVPVAGRDRMMCCWSSADGTTYVSGNFSGSNMGWAGGCRIEPGSTPAGGQAAGSTTPAAGPIKLEGSDRMVVLFRIVDRQVERVRSFSQDCELDAGGRQVHWIQDVRPAESIALLESLIGAEPDRKSRISNAALSAIGMHAEPGAAPTLIRLARSHASASVRGEAIFWVAQLAGIKAVGAISESIESDPDTEVKKRAVFALSQLPKAEGVPLLIDVAKKNRNPAVRKQAIFWLGQSRDPRAIEFFVEILK